MGASVGDRRMLLLSAYCRYLPGYSMEAGAGCKAKLVSTQVFAQLTRTSDFVKPVRVWVSRTDRLWRGRGNGVFCSISDSDTRQKQEKQRYDLKFSRQALLACLTLVFESDYFTFTQGTVHICPTGSLNLPVDYSACLIRHP